jgi:hypothetical protein
VRGVAGRLERSREWSERGEKSGFQTEWRAAECARRQRGREGKRGRGEGVPGVGMPRDAWELVGSGPDRRVVPAAARARTFGQRQSGREMTDRWAGTVMGGGVADRRGRPVSGTGRAWARARARERAWAGPRGEGN